MTTIPATKSFLRNKWHQKCNLSYNQLKKLEAAKSADLWLPLVTYWAAKKNHEILEEIP